MSPFEIQSRITGYNLNPHLYDDSDVAEIKEYADIYGIPFDNSIEGAKRAQKSSGMLSQFTSGFTEGVLGPFSMGGWSEEPEDEAQAIAHSMGHLLGFALPLAGSVLTLGGSGFARLGLSATQVATRAGSAGVAKRGWNQARRALGYTGEVLKGGGEVLRKGSKVSIAGKVEVPIKSVPLLGADALEDWVKRNLAEHGFEVAKHINKSTGAGKALDIAFQSSHLGVASVLSGLFDGENNEMNNLIFGGIAGGAFGGLGNFVTMGKMIQHPNVKVAGAGMKGLWEYSKEFAKGNKERLASMVAGSAFQGGMATMQGAPTATQIYEYLLGGFFGFQAQGAVAKEANDYFNKFNSTKNEDGTPKYTFEDVRGMLKNPEFQKLAPEAQQIVKDAHFHHLGDMYDNTLSMASAVLRDAMESDLKLSYKRKASELNKKVEDLDKYEKAEAKGEVADLTPSKVAEMQMRDRIVGKVYEGIVNPDKATPEIVKIANRLTDKELKEVIKDGDITSLDRVINEHFESKPFEEVKTTLSDIIKAENALSQGQPEVSSEPMIKRFVDKLQDKLVELPYKPEDVISDAITLFNKKEIKASDNVTKVLKEYMDTLTKKYKGLVIDKEMERGLGQLFNRIKQEEIRPIVTFNVEKNQVENVWYKNILNKIIASRQPKPADEVIMQNRKNKKNEPLWSEEIRVFEFGELSSKDNYGNWKVFKPYDKKLNFDTGVMESEIKPLDWIQIQKHLWNQKGDLTKRGKFYLKIPKKDNGVERIYPFHPDISKTKLSQIFGEIIKNTAGVDKKMLEAYYRTDRDVWYQTMGINRSKKSETIEDTGEIPVKKIISGMQSGVDMAGLRAGEKLGIETGGTAPPKNITKEVSGESNRKALADRYKVVEGEADPSIYPKRTMKNVDDADATIAIRTKSSAGTDKTIGYAQTGKWQKGNSKEGVYDGHKPLLVLNDASLSQKNIKAIRDFVSKNPGVINIAGHSSKALGKLSQKLFEKAFSFDKKVKKEGIASEIETGAVIDNSDIAFLDRVYAESFKSNYLYEKNYNFKDAVARVKREALFASKAFFEVNPKDFSKITKNTDEIEIYLIDDSKGLIDGLKKATNRLVRGKKPETYNVIDANGNIVEKAWESKIDGWVVMHSELYKQFLKSNHLEERTSHMKPSVAVEVNGQLFLLKGGVHPSRKGYDNFLKNPNSMIVVTSASKHIPKGAKIYKGQATGKETFKVMDNQGPSFKMPVKDFRINYGVYGDSHSAQATTIKKQMHTFFDKITMSEKGFDNFMNDVLEFPLRGTPENNAYLKALKDNPKLANPKGFDISKISDKDFIEIINDVTHPLHKELNLEVFKKIRKMQLEEEMPEAHERLQELKEYANSFETWYKATDYNPIASVVNSKLYQRAIHTYRLQRFTQPKWEFSGSGWVAGVDPIMEMITGGLKANAKYDFWDGAKIISQKVGHVKLGYSHKDKKIKWLDGKTTTLEKAYDEFLDAVNTKKPKETIARMRTQLMLAVMRVPASAISGTRALLFDGFVGNDVNVSDYGVYMRARDHFYIDGADVDGDKVFFYQGLPKEYMRDLVKNDNLLERTKKGVQVLFDNKDKRFDKIFGSELGTKKNKYGISEADYVSKNALSQWSPGALRKAGQSSYAGKQGMGTVVNTKSFMNTVLADIITNKGGNLNLEVRSKKGNLLGRLTGKTSETILNADNGYYVIGVEASSRTADSANYYRMADANQMQEILWKSAFKNLKWTPEEAGQNIDGPKFWMLKNSPEYNQIYDLNQKLYGFNYDSNRPFSTQEVQQTLQTTQIETNYMNSILTIANHMSKNNININPLGYFNFRNLDSSIKLLATNIWRDPLVREFAVRKNLTIKPQYWNIQYDKVFNIMMNRHSDYRTPSGKQLKRIVDSGLGKQDYADFIWEGLQKKLPKDVQDTFDKMYTNERADLKGFHEKPISKHHPTIERDFRLNDTWDIYSAITALETGKKLKTAMSNAGLRTETKGENVPYQDINNVAWKLTQGQKLSDTEKQIQARWRKKIQEAVDSIQGIPAEQLDVFTKYGPLVKSQNDWIVFRDYIAVGAHHIKTLFRKGFKQKDINVYENQGNADVLIRKYMKDITKRSEEYGIDPRIAHDYFFSHLLGSLSPQTFSKGSRLRSLKQDLLEAKTDSKKKMIQEYIDNLTKNYEHTGIPKFTWELQAIPDGVKSEFLKGYAKTFDVLNNKTPEEVKTIRSEFFFRDKVVAEKNQPESIPEFTEVQQLKIDRLLDVEAPKVDPSKVPADIQQKVIPRIKRTLKTLSLPTARIDDLYTLMKIEQGFTGTTSIRNATFTDLRNFDRYLRDFIEQGAIKDPKGRAWYKKIYDWQFPQAVGERMNTHDMNHIYTIKAPVKNLDGSMGEASIKVPLSAMSHLQRSSNAIRRFEDSVKNQLQEHLFKSIGVKQEVEALSNGIERFQKLMEIAVKQRNAKREISGERAKFYQEELAQSKADIENLSGEIFNITRDGKTIRKTGEELISDIQKQLDTFFKEEMYEAWVGAGLFNKEGVWEKIDWKRIDNNHEYSKNGLIIHDLIRYDKWGRFDIENFHNKVIKSAGLGEAGFIKMMGNRNSPLSVELLNRVQYEIALEEIITFNKIKSNSLVASEYRNNYRKTEVFDKKTQENIPNETAFIGIGQVREGYFPQMMHNKDKLMPWIKNEQLRLQSQLEDFFTLLTSSGKLRNAPSEIKKRYKPTEFQIKAVLGLVPEKWRMTKKQVIDEIMAKQEQDFEIMTGQSLKDNSRGEWGVEFLNAQYRDKKKDWVEGGFASRPGSGGVRGEIPMPYFSYSPDVLKAYAEQWTSSFFKNILSMAGRDTIRKYELLNPMDADAKKPWATEMRLFIKEQMGHSAILPMDYIGLSSYQRKRMEKYISENKDRKDVSEIIMNYKERLLRDTQFKKNNKVKGIKYAISDQAIIDWLDIKSQGLGRLTGKLKGFGTIEKPKLPFYGELPRTQKARERRLHEILVNTGNFEAKMSLLSLLAHPKTALGNIFGGSQNTISNAGLRNFIKANDTKWLLTHVFKDAKLKDGTPITDKNTIRRWISEVGALESFYVTEASMDKSLSVTRMRPFINEVQKKLFTKEMTQTKWKEIAQKHRVWDSIVASGGWFMRVSEAKLRADAFMAHYLHARETYSQLVPDMAFNNPYLIRQALKGVEATQFLYHNVNRPAIARSAMGKVLTRFQPFAWNSVRFRRHIYRTAKKYGMTDKQSVDRLKRFMAQDLMVASLASIFVASIFDSTLPPPMSWMQSTAEWLFGDPEERERAFFSSYPHPALAPLQTVTAPVHRYYLPVITGLINGDWDKFTSYYIHTMYPGGRLARSLYMTMQAPEMFPEFMFGIPVHKLGANMRKRKKEEENATQQST